MISCSRGEKRAREGGRDENEVMGSPSGVKEGAGKESQLIILLESTSCQRRERVNNVAVY